MDDFKRQTMDMTTSYDLVKCPVHYRSSFRRKLMNIVRRRARRKLKRDLVRVCEIVERFTAHEKLYKQQKEKAQQQSQYDYIDDLADIFPWIPRGEYKRVKE